MRRSTIIVVGLLCVGCQREVRAPSASPNEPERAQKAQARQQVRRPKAWQPPDLEERPVRPKVADKGVFNDLDERVELRFPTWLEGRREVVSTQGYVFVDGRAIGMARAGTGPTTKVGYSDRDGDAIPDQLDILIGARKTVANAAPYQGGYQSLDFPGGDVPRTEGVCTDVIVRAIRNAGLDLQQELYDEIGRAPRAFPMVKERDTHIDHRRVKTLLPYFERRWESRPIEHDDISDWLPGDIVFMNTMRDARPDHVGIVSDRLGPSGKPLIVNNWTDGYETAEMDLLEFVPITHRFRMKQSFAVDSEHSGIDGLLRRWSVPPETTQVVVVEVDGWNRHTATLSRWERAEHGWQKIGDELDATVGQTGVALGRGLDDAAGYPHKVEGDGRAPVGVFRLGTAFGTSAPGGEWPFREVTDQDAWVDDPALPTYNTLVDTPPDGSHEKLAFYTLGVVVEHNMPAKPGAGSAIFLHTWQGTPGPTLGCTAMAHDHLAELVRWLQPEAKPHLVQVVDRL